MRQSSYKIGTSQKEIRALAGDHYVNINIKVSKSNVSDILVDGILEAGTLLTKEGGKVTTNTTSTDAYGIVFQDVDFNDSRGTEVVPIMIHGFVNTSKIKLDETNAAIEKQALNMISFL